MTSGLRPRENPVCSIRLCRLKCVPTGTEGLDALFGLNAIDDHVPGHHAAGAFGKQTKYARLAVFDFLEYRGHDTACQGFLVHNLGIFVRCQINDPPVFVRACRFVQGIISSS